MPQKRLVFTLGDLKELIVETYKDVDTVDIFNKNTLKIESCDIGSLDVNDDTFVLEAICK
jgi:hypothetical protein